MPLIPIQRIMILNTIGIKLCCFLAILAMIGLPTESYAKTSKRNLIQSINAKEKSIKVNGNTYFMREDVRITYKGKKAKFEDIKVGMRGTINARVRTVKGVGKGADKKKNTYDVRTIYAHDFTPRAKKK